MAAVAIQPSISAVGLGPTKAAQVQAVQSLTLQNTAKKDVYADLHYYKENEDGSPPHPTYIDRPETYDRPFETHNVKIQDVTGEEDKFSLDQNGFQIYRHQSSERDFLDESSIKSGYYLETEELLKKVTGASRVFIFDHTIRRQLPSLSTQNRNLRGPVQRVHIDQSYKAALSRVPHHLPEDADVLLKGRVQIINVWRPIKTVQRDPLAIADAGSVSDSDLIVTELIYPDRRGETYQVRHKEDHQWYYKAGLTPEEVILIKCFDSKTDGRARRVPHSAFVDPTASKDSPPRESIEVRALVFHPEDHE
ncbi:methyltransferase-like protein [Colletotrichum truncatum]|uniref:Methyltransferase-like protein n=1 Tax=Colletotrichum truncatum TaxID=5467 RepID=A0ACC3YKX2_COLTU|nr:methyltransferase-like protein [Colletotrichum truncatum]KAF6782866.1 methyltransferase-like protein [Colletotrichum truncatum]